jgi:hypothetical protein
LKKKKYIICLDDEMPILWNLKEQLRKSFGHSISIETFENGKDALLLIEEINQENAELPVSSSAIKLCQV